MIEDRRRMGAARTATEISHRQAEIVIGSIEKMSKSKKNVVDPDEIVRTYGADTARWFMLSDSPPERDVQWTEAGIEGASRFQQRVWKLVQRDRSNCGAARGRRDEAACRHRWRCAS